jgi:hypothetical protein
MNEVERQKQQKQFIDTHNLGLDRERMMAKPTWTWFEFLAFMNFLDYQKIEQAFPGEGVWVGVEKNYPLFEKLWSDIQRCKKMVQTGDMPYEALPIAYFTWANQGNYFYLKRMYEPIIEKLRNQARIEIPSQKFKSEVDRKFTVVKLSREDGYFRELEELLETYSISGKPRPSAKEVLIKFKEENPKVANIIAFCQKNRSFTYLNGKGEEKIVDLDALRAAIKGRVAK